MMWIKFRTFTGDVILVNMSHVIEVHDRPDGVDLVYTDRTIHYDANIEDVENAMMEYYKGVRSEQERWLNGEM